MLDEDEMLVTTILGITFADIALAVGREEVRANETNIFEALEDVDGRSAAGLIVAKAKRQRVLECNDLGLGDDDLGRLLLMLPETVALIEVDLSDNALTGVPSLCLGPHLLRLNVTDNNLLILPDPSLCPVLETSDFRGNPLLPPCLQVATSTLPETQHLLQHAHQHYGGGGTIHRCRQAAVLLMGLSKHALHRQQRCAVEHIPRDVMQICARMVWESHFDHVWLTDGTRGGKR
jgi:hypothetical protein